MPAELSKPDRVARMKFTQRRAWGKTVNGSQQKAVLVSLAAVEGDVISYDRLADLAGCSIVTVSRAIKVLLSLGLIREVPVPSTRSSAYVVTLPARPPAPPVTSK